MKNEGLPGITISLAGLIHIFYKTGQSYNENPMPKVKQGKFFLRAASRPLNHLITRILRVETWPFWVSERI